MIVWLDTFFICENIVNFMVSGIFYILCAEPCVNFYVWWNNVTVFDSAFACLRTDQKFMWGERRSLGGMLHYFSQYGGIWKYTRNRIWVGKHKICVYIFLKIFHSPCLELAQFPVTARGFLSLLYLEGDIVDWLWTRATPGINIDQSLIPL